MQHRWVGLVILFKAYANSQDFQDLSPSFSDSFLTASDLVPDFSGLLAFCGSEVPANSEVFDISSLISRRASDSQLLQTSSNIWNLEDPHYTDDLWGSGSVGEPSWLSDWTMDLEQFAFNEKSPQNDRPSTDLCSAEPPPEGDGGWEPPWIPIDPNQPDRDCLDDGWEKFCCPQGITPLAGTDGCVTCKAMPLSFLPY